MSEPQKAAAPTSALDRYFKISERGSSIADGIGAGFLSYVFIRLVQGRGKEVHWLMYVVSAVFLIFFANGLITGWMH